MFVANLMVLEAVKWRASKKAYLDYVGKLGILINVFMTMIYQIVAFFLKFFLRIEYVFDNCLNRKRKEIVQLISVMYRKTTETNPCKKDMV